ncbi:MAG: 50S ribosomal protein L23 [Victivallales bacterium]|jgi:large subunit ribosomal protein L23|nr:50S ribosomal protein L23 [Victivallales bacterium]MBT7303010.1 50S ribosomal protein L23 [Victivallales bacterium]
MKDPYSIVQTVLVTEKGTELADELDQYSFKVAKDANKIEIKSAVEALFDVKVSSVNTLNRKGKRKRMRTTRYGKRPDWKKAIVTLSEGEIDIL